MNMTMKVTEHDMKMITNMHPNKTDCQLVIEHLRAAIVALQSGDSANCRRHIDTARAELNDEAAPIYREFYDYRPSYHGEGAR
jgi:hypothetical protein